MTINIKNKDIELLFGIRFIRELDKEHFVMKDGVKFGAGLELRAPALTAFDTVALSEIIYAATSTCPEKNRPSANDIDAFVESHEKLEDLFDEVLSELKKGNATRLKMKQIEKNLKEQSK